MGSASATQRHLLLVLYVSKVLPSSKRGRFYALGHVFSGSTSAVCNVRAQGPSYQPGSFRKDDLYSMTIKEVLVVKSHSFGRVETCVVGTNIVVLLGVDQFLLKGGTITTDDSTSKIKAIKSIMSPIQVGGGEETDRPSYTYSSRVCGSCRSHVGIHDLRSGLQRLVIPGIFRR